MKLNKERIHQYGASNIDFRTKKDEESIKKYQPWLMGKDLGTMGISDFSSTRDEKKQKFLSTQKIATLKDIINDVPNPKYHQTAEFYHKNNIEFLNKKSLYETEHPAQLNEMLIGKELFTGDSMMISYNTKLKHKKDKILSTKDRLKKNKMIENLYRDKNKKNKSAIQETQLVKTEAKETLDGKVDLTKLKEIRLAIKRRYANRSNMRKLFKMWDRSNNGYINLYDVHYMINKLAIPINFNETKALIASATDSEVIRLEDFVSMIHSDNKALNVDLKSIEYKSEEEYLSGIRLEDLHNKMKNDIILSNNIEDLKTIKEFLRVRIPLSVKLFKNLDEEGTNYIKISELKEMIYNFKLPTRFQNENIINPLIEKYKDVSGEKINYKDFLDDLVDSKEKNDFFNFKDMYVEKIKKKIINSEEQMEVSKSILKEEEKKKNEIMKELERNMKLHAELIQKGNENNKFEYDKYVNIYQPSLQFNSHIYKNIKENIEKYKEFEDKFSAHPSLRKEVRIQTRYGSNPPYQNTKWITQSVPNSGMYVSENDRFSKEVNYFQQQEKNLKWNKYKNKINMIKSYNDQNENKKNMENILKEQKNVFSLLQRTDKLYKYEMINKTRNELIE